jgi:integrase
LRIRKKLYQMKGLYKMSGSRYWWYRWSGTDGKRHAVSLKTSDEAEAIVKAREIPVDFRASVPRNALVPIIDRYLSEAQVRNKRPLRPEVAKTNRYILVKFATDVGANYVSDVSIASLNRWLASLKKTYSQESLCSYSAVVLTFGRWLHKRRLVTYYPFEGFERPSRPSKGRLNWMHKEDVQKLIDSAPSDDQRFILYCGFHAGLRRSEISWAKVDWFDLENNLIHVTNDPETGALLKDENRVVPITKPFSEFLMKYFENRSPTEYVLAPKKEKGLAKYRYDFLKRFKSHVKSCTIHDMRRSFASNLASAGVSIYKIAQWLGDRVDVVERSYGHLAPADQDVNKLV